MSIVTKEEVKDFLNLTGNTKDNLIDFLIPKVENFVLNYCGRTSFEYAEYIEYFDAGGNSFLVKNNPIDSSKAISLYVDPDREFGSDTLIDEEDYGIDHEAGIIRLDYKTEYTFQAVKIKYWGGYLQAKIPEGLKLGTVKLVALAIKDGEGGELGVSSRSLPDGSVNFLKREVPRELDQFIND